MSTNKPDNNLSPKLLSATKLALAIILLSGIGLYLYFFQPSWLRFSFINKNDAPVETILEPLASSTDICSNCVRRAIDGVMVPPEAVNPALYAVMIDNFTSARPQAGLSAASLVYEAPAEGGITRYLAIFTASTTVAEIGPIRSARSYFLNWAKELGAIYVHVGGSPEALEMAKKLGTNNLDEFYQSNFFWRSSDRSAPHNVLTSSEKLDSYLQLKSENILEISPWQFKDSASSTDKISNQIKIKYGKGYDVTWKYQDDGSYYRFLDEKEHIDANGTKITAKNIIIHLSSFNVTDDKLRLNMSSALSGTALLCQDAKCQLGNWSKSSQITRAKYYYKDGTDFIANAGTTWIEVIDDLQKITY